MALTHRQRVRRVAVRTEELAFWIDRERRELTAWEADGRPIAPGDPWPTDDGVVRFTHGTVMVPAEWPLDETRLVLDLGGEGLVSMSYAGEEQESFGLDPFHQRFPLRAPSFAIAAEVVARLPFGEPVRDPHLQTAALVHIDMGLERLVRLLRLVAETVRVVGEHPVVEPLLAAAESAIARLDWPSATVPYLARVQEREQMQRIWSLPSDLPAAPPGLDPEAQEAVEAAADALIIALAALRERFGPEGALAVTGHAHLDLAWLWPLAETRRKARRTFSTVLGLMERYPEFRFNQSSAQIYAFVEEDDPGLFARVKERVAEGQWEPVGGMWVEPDINMPCGESLARQLLYGQRYFRRQFGRTHSVCWLPDCFGFSPALPQLLRLAGIPYFFTIKLTWSETNVFPYDLFYWEGLDGSRVLAHMFDNPGHEESKTGGYNADTGPWTTVQTWRNFRGKHHFGESLLSIGYGDGGGGVTAEMLEKMRAEDVFPVIPVLRPTLVHEFYERLDAAVREQILPVWLGEMYLELHRGTLTTQGRTKYLHRRAERDLVAVEALTTLDYLLGGPEPASLEAQWRVVLRNEFHDILPGSGIRQGYEEANAELSATVDCAGDNARQAVDRLADRLVPPGDTPSVFAVNADLAARPLRVTLDRPLEGAQAVEGGWVATAEEMVPGLGTLTAAIEPPAEAARADAGLLENRFLRVEIGADGTLTRIVDRRAGREILAGRGNQIWAYVDKPLNWDAWDVDADYGRHGEEIVAGEPPVVTERGPHRAAIRVIRRFRASTIVQEYRLWANSARLDIHTVIDWHERRFLLKARFPLAIRSREALAETAFGVLPRPTHRNTSWEQARFEVAAHRFIDLAEPNYGVALLNDGKYGHHAIGSELGLSLLRSPAYPDPLADEGRQEFTYALLPHEGAWLEGGVLMEAEDLNRPLFARVASAGEMGPQQILALPGLPVGLGCLKVAEDGETPILRVYEPQGARGRAVPELPQDWRVEEEVDLLEETVGPADFDFTPFQVHNWRLRRGG